MSDLFRRSWCMSSNRDSRPFVICLRADAETPFDDNEHGVYTRCQCPVQHRPHVPTPNRLLCLDCFITIAKAAGGVIEMHATPETVLELKDLTQDLKKRRGDAE